MSIQSATRVWIARREFRAHVLEEVRRRKTAAVVVLQAFAMSNPVARRRPLIRSHPYSRRALTSAFWRIYFFFFRCYE